MSARKVSVNVLPEGAALCGWCDDQEAWRKAMSAQCSSIERQLRVLATLGEYRDILVGLADQLAKAAAFGERGAVDETQGSLL